MSGSSFASELVAFIGWRLSNNDRLPLSCKHLDETELIFYHWKSRSIKRQTSAFDNQRQLTEVECSLLQDALRVNCANVSPRILQIGKDLETFMVVHNGVPPTCRKFHDNPEDVLFRSVSRIHAGSDSVVNGRESTQLERYYIDEIMSRFKPAELQKVTLQVCDSLQQYTEHFPSQVPSLQSSNLEHRRLFTLYQALRLNKSGFRKSLNQEQIQMLNGVLARFPATSIPLISESTLAFFDPLIVYLVQFPHKLPSYKGVSKLELAAYHRRLALLNPLHVCRKNMLQPDTAYLEALVDFLPDPVCRDCADIQRVIDFIVQKRRLPLCSKSDSFERVRYQSMQTWIRAYQNALTRKASVQLVLNNLLNVIGPYSSLKQTSINKARRIKLKVIQAAVDDERERELVAYKFVNRRHMDGEVLSGGRFASCLSSRELNQCVRAAGGVFHYCMDLSGEYTCAKSSTESMGLNFYLQALQDKVSESLEPASSGKLVLAFLKSYNIVEFSDHEQTIKLQFLLRFNRAKDLRIVVRLFQGELPLDYWRSVSRKAHIIHGLHSYKRDHWRQLVGSSALPSTSVLRRRITGKTHRRVTVVRSILSSPSVLLCRLLTSMQLGLCYIEEDIIPEVVKETVVTSQADLTEDQIPESLSDDEIKPVLHQRLATNGLSQSWPKCLLQKPKKCGTWGWFSDCAHCECQIRLDANNGMMTNDIHVEVFTSESKKEFCGLSKDRLAPRFSCPEIDICKICERKVCPGTGVVAHQQARLFCTAALCEHCARPMVQVNDRADRDAMPWHVNWSDPCTEGTYEEAAQQGVKLCRRCFSTQMVGIGVGTLVKDFMNQQTLKRCVKCCRAHFSMEFNHIVRLLDDPFPNRTDRDNEDEEILQRKCCDPCVKHLLGDVDPDVLSSTFKETRRKVCWVLCNECHFAPHKWTAQNLMDPGPQHLVFQHLSHLGHLLLARIHPTFSIFPVQSGWLGQQGTVYCVGLRLAPWAKTLPWKCSDLPVILITPRNRKVKSVDAEDVDEAGVPVQPTDASSDAPTLRPPATPQSGGTSKRPKTQSDKFAASIKTGRSKVVDPNSSSQLAQGNAALRINKKLFKYCLDFIFQNHKFIHGSTKLDAEALELLPEDGVPDGLQTQEDTAEDSDQSGWAFQQSEFEGWWDSQSNRHSIGIVHLLIRDSLRAWWSTQLREMSHKTRLQHHDIIHWNAGRECWHRLMLLAEEDYGGALTNAHTGQSSCSVLSVTVLFRVLEAQRSLLDCRYYLDSEENFTKELKKELMCCQVEAVLKADLYLGEVDTSSRVTREQEELKKRGVPEAWVAMPEIQEDPIQARVGLC